MLTYSDTSVILILVYRTGRLSRYNNRYLILKRRLKRLGNGSTAGIINIHIHYLVAMRTVVDPDGFDVWRAVSLTGKMECFLHDRVTVAP